VASCSATPPSRTKHGQKNAGQVARELLSSRYRALSGNWIRVGASAVDRSAACSPGRLYWYRRPSARGVRREHAAQITYVGPEETEVGSRVSLLVFAAGQPPPGRDEIPALAEWRAWCAPRLNVRDKAFNRLPSLQALPPRAPPPSRYHRLAPSPSESSDRMSRQGSLRLQFPAV